MKITNKVFFNWSVEDSVYPYQSTYEYTVEEFSKINMEDIRNKQELEYSEWLNVMKQMEQGQ
jgi:hypothetical protein